MIIAQPILFVERKTFELTPNKRESILSRYKLFRLFPG